jgi:hypothetical protein
MGSLKRIARLEKVIGSERKMTWAEFISMDHWPDFSQGLQTLAEALGEITGQATTPEEVEKCLGRLSNDCN